MDRSCWAATSVIVAHPASTSAGHRERRQPAVAEASGAPQLGRRGAAQPDVDRLLDGPGPQGHAVDVEVLAVVVDVVLGPQAAHERHRLVEQAGPGRALDPEGPVLGRDRGPEPHARQQPPARQAVEAGQLLGQHHGIAAGHHEHAGAQLELAGAAGGHGQGHERVGRRAGEALAQPQRVEPALLEGVDEACELLAVTRQRLGAEPHADADLHALHVVPTAAVPAGSPRRR